jgi:hypothetical protein
MMRDFNHRGQRRQPLPGQTERIIVTHIPAPPIHIEFALTDGQVNVL